ATFCMPSPFNGKSYMPNLYFSLYTSFCSELVHESHTRASSARPALFGCIVRCKTEAEFEIKGSRTERGKGWTTNVLGAEKPDGKGSILCRVLDPRSCGQHRRAKGKTAPPCCCNRGRRTAIDRDRSLLQRFPCRAER